MKEKTACCCVMVGNKRCSHPIAGWLVGKRYPGPVAKWLRCSSAPVTDGKFPFCSEHKEKMEFESRCYETALHAFVEERVPLTDFDLIATRRLTVENRNRMFEEGSPTVYWVCRKEVVRQVSLEELTFDESALIMSLLAAFADFSDGAVALVAKRRKAWRGSQRGAEQEGITWFIRRGDLRRLDYA